MSDEKKPALAIPDTFMGRRARHERFCREYLKDFNQTAAYMRTYPGTERKVANRNAVRLMKDEWVRNKIAELTQNRLTLEDVTPGRIIMELARIGFSDIGDVVETTTVTGSDGLAVNLELPKQLSDIPEDARRAIKEIEYTKQGGRRIKMADKEAALSKLAVIVGAIPESNRQTVAGKASAIDHDALGEDEVTALIAEALDDADEQGGTEIIDMDELGNDELADE